MAKTRLINSNCKVFVMCLTVLLRSQMKCFKLWAEIPWFLFTVFLLPHVLFCKNLRVRRFSCAVFFLFRISCWDFLTMWDLVFISEDLRFTAQGVGFKI